jgi:hypothetical protein
VVTRKNISSMNEMSALVPPVIFVRKNNSRKC